MLKRLTFVLITLLASIPILLIFCQSSPEGSTLFIYSGKYGDEIELLNGKVKSITMGDQRSPNNYYEVVFDNKGNTSRTFDKSRFHRYSYDFNYQITAWYTTFYNKKGQRIKVTAKYNVRPDICGCNKGLAEWKFDSIGRIKEYKPNRLTGFTEYKYGKTGLLDSELVWGKALDPEVYRYEYDNNKRIKTLFHYNYYKELRSKSAFTYQQFDTHQNWTQRTLNIGDTTYVVKRKITYYP